MAAFSITRRLILALLLTELTLAFAIAAFSTYLTRKQLQSAFDIALHGRAMSVAALVRFSEGANPHLIFDSRLVPPPLDRERPDFYRIVDHEGRLIAESLHKPPQFAATTNEQGTYWTIGYGGNEYRVARLGDVPVLDREDGEMAASQPVTITVLYAASTEDIRERAWWVATMTGGGAIVLLALSTLVTIWAIRRGLSPVTELAGSASRVTSESWKLNLPEQARATQELIPLTEAMDEMLARLQQAFTSQREFVANAAHELKTPIAVLKSTLQLALQRPRSAEEYRAQLQQALEDAERVESLTHSMLRLARAEQMRNTRSQGDLPWIDVTDSCTASVDRLRPFAQARAVTIEVAAAGTQLFRANPEDLELVWTNLVENAIRYSPPQGLIRVSVATAQGAVRVTVQDSGHGIPESELQHIFDRFHRADASRSHETGGYGLGLAISKAMVEAYGGSIHAKSQTGSGTTVEVSLPVSS